MKKHDELRGVFRRALTFLQEKYDVTPRALAMRGDVSPSTVYRWLDENAQFVPNLAKLKQVFDAFGEQLPEELTGGAPSSRAPGFAESDMVTFDGDITAPPSKPETNHGRWQITSDVLDLEGFRIGDVLDFDMGLKPAPGDIVVAQVYNFQRGTAETVLRVFQPPYLLTHSSNRAIDPKPFYVDNERVVIMGTFLRMFRERAA